MIRFWSICVLTMMFMISCSDDCDNDTRCDLEPDSGLCQAAFLKYYYDQEEQACKTFTWGGCGGVVPFETLEDCEAKCGCN